MSPFASIYKKSAGVFHEGTLRPLPFRQKPALDEGIRFVVKEEEFHEQTGYQNFYLHKHNWISGHIYARLHANGVCEIYAHHINNRFVDEGCDFEDVVPVVGFVVEDDDPAIARHSGAWDGSEKEIALGGVRIDVEEVSRLARPEQPGSLEKEGRFLVWQPYTGVELYGGICAEALTNAPFIFHAEQKIMPRGMARTWRFSFSLSDRSPRVARYLAPAWWYGVCEEFSPEPLLPVSNCYGRWLTNAGEWIQERIVRGGFEDGSMPRGVTAARQVKGRTRYEPGRRRTCGSQKGGDVVRRIPPATSSTLSSWIVAAAIAETTPAPCEPKPERKNNMPAINGHTNGAAMPHLNGANASTAPVTSTEEKPSLEVAIEKLDAFKVSFREALTGTTELTALLRQAVRDQKAGAKEIHNVRQTIRSLQGIRI